MLLGDLPAELRYTGRPVLIMGGGPSLPSDLKAFDAFIAPAADPIRISVNDHAARCCDCDLVVGLDNTGRLDRSRGLYIQGRGAVVVSPEPWADIRVRVPADMVWSAELALRVAEHLDPWSLIVLAGFDLYQGDGPVYWHGDEREPAALRTSDHYSLEGQLAAWRRIRGRLTSPYRVAAIGGKLTALFPYAAAADWLMRRRGSSQRPSESMRGGRDRKSVV